MHHPTVMTVMPFIVQLLFKFQPANLTHDSFVALQPFLTISARNLDTRQFRHLTAFFQNFSRQPQHPSPSSPYLFKLQPATWPFVALHTFLKFQLATWSPVPFVALHTFFEISAGNLVAGHFRHLTATLTNIFSRQPNPLPRKKPLFLPMKKLPVR